MFFKKHLKPINIQPMKTIFKMALFLVAVLFMSSCTPKKTKTAETEDLDSICSIETEEKSNTINQDSILKQFGVRVYLDSSFVVATSKLKSNEIPNWVFNMKKLKNLTIRGMFPEYVHEDYGAYHIKDDCFRIYEIPSKIKNLTKLTSLSLPDNDIQSLPVELTALKNLKIIDLSGNEELDNVNNIEKIVSLEYVSLSGCHLTEIPANIGNLKHLKELDLKGSFISAKEQIRIKRALPNCKIRFSQN
jgi:Leucine-rich repeat (LRR) protein